MSDSPSPGLLAAVRSLATTVVATGRTRLELLANEFEEQKLRALRLLLLACGMLFCLGLGIVALLAFLVLAFPGNAPGIAGGAAALFLLAAALLSGALRRAAQSPDKAFAASLAELEEDVRQLKAALREDGTGTEGGSR
ncbi:MAG: phage holin family protein [Proteobacteria bacterium]|nr:phage holin family protein [Pseudomonadota bacterium]